MGAIAKACQLSRSSRPKMARLTLAVTPPVNLSQPQHPRPGVSLGQNLNLVIVLKMYLVGHLHLGRPGLGCLNFPACQLVLSPYRPVALAVSPAR